MAIKRFEQLHPRQLVAEFDWTINNSLTILVVISFILRRSNLMRHTDVSLLVIFNLCLLDRSKAFRISINT